MQTVIGCKQLKLCILNVAHNYVSIYKENLKIHEIIMKMSNRGKMFNYFCSYETLLCVGSQPKGFASTTYKVEKGDRWKPCNGLTVKLMPTTSKWHFTSHFSHLLKTLVIKLYELLNKPFVTFNFNCTLLFSQGITTQFIYFLF